MTFRSSADSLVIEDTNNSNDIFLRDRETGKTELISLSNDGTIGNSASSNGTISANGRFVAFDSEATNLISTDSNDWDDVFIRDRGLGSILDQFVYLPAILK